jgi:hypothetical protein
LSTIDRKAPSAVGERQILPIQTNKTLFFNSIDVVQINTNGESFPSWNYISICAGFKFDL